MTSRERVRLALNHREPDRVPLDLGGGPVTGMHVDSVYALRQALGLDAPSTPVKVVEPYQMLGEIGLDLMEAVGVDVIGLSPPRTMFGFPNSGWKPWTTFQGTPVLVPEGFNTAPEADGSLLMYPEGDRSVPATGRMPAGGWYFDTIVPQQPIDDEALNPDENTEEFGPVSEADLAYFGRETERLYTSTDKAIYANFGGTGFGDIALVPAPWLKHARGIRGVEEWYMSTLTRRDYVYRVFERQCAVALENLARIHDVVGDRVSALLISGADFGTQRGPFIPVETYRDLYQPFHRQVNDWLHRHTPWKTFIHSCGGVRPLIPEFIESGFDILNPVQCSAARMDAGELKREFGGQIVFWGGGVDTQNTLPFGTPDEVRTEVRERIRTFAPGGGFVFNTVHNVQSQTPVRNILALYESVREYGGYPIR
ncbi:MAG: methyltransferase [Candidatus Hydrogenedentes bacterium]|nr:methyltransferase [Candidatus Hydrogenedentota bacterium]